MLFERRAFITFLGYAVASRCLPAVAQPATRPPIVGVLMGFGLPGDSETKARTEAFEQGLKEEGWIVGTDLRIEYRFSEGNFDRIRAFAQELNTLRPDCILGHSTPVVAALMQVTRTIPIVFVAVTDPIGSRFVESVQRPGGNITGFTVFQGKMTGKYLSILRELIPQLSSAAIIYNPTTAPGAKSVFLPAFIEAARSYRIEPITLQVSSKAEIESGLAQLSDRPDIGLIVMPDNFTALYRELLVTLAARYRIPTIYPYRYFAELGGLLSYGVDAPDLFRRAAGYVSRILRGANPAELPVQGPTKFQLAINLKTAKDLGLTVPKILLAGAEYLIK
jgi:putative ABC transport system substrate-binding protein